ncbi:MAG TPA: hypothetical protein VHV08_15660, partial [Pirellulales bacterium]|nr:hypothetical protein [Pirellulales bacterium]
MSLLASCPLASRAQHRRGNALLSRPQSAPSREPRRYFKTGCEALEERTLLSVAPLYYAATGTGNNVANPSWGAAGSDL